MPKTLDLQQPLHSVIAQKPDMVEPQNPALSPGETKASAGQQAAGLGIYADKLADSFSFSGPAVQLKSEGNSPSPKDETHQIAAGGMSGASQLPFHSEIQRSFGSYDVSGIRASTGGAADVASRELGAEAYTMGNRVAFRETPTLQTTAHEATHALQQRAGKRPPGDVGRVGDQFECHANAVAQAVESGRSAEPVLSRLIGSPESVASSAGGEAVQMVRRGITARDVMRQLRQAGFQQVRQRGSHVRFEHPDGRRTTVSDHGRGRNEIPLGTQRNIERDAGITLT